MIFLRNIYCYTSKYVLTMVVVSICPFESLDKFGGLYLGQLSRDFPDLHSEITRYCCQVEIFCCFFSFYSTMLLKFRAACSSSQAEEGAVKCLL